MTEQPPINPSPKTRFLGAKNAVESHRKLLDLPAMQFGLDFALLEYQRILCESNADANGAAANHFKLRGALEFVHCLKNLSEIPRMPVLSTVPNLDHNVK